MTLIVALKSDSSIIMASDSRGTVGDPRGLTAISDEHAKLSSIGPCGIGVAGAAELGRSLLDEFAKQSFGPTLDADKVVERVRGLAARLFSEWFGQIQPANRPGVHLIIAGYRAHRSSNPEQLVYLLDSQSNFAPQLFGDNACMVGVPQYAVYLANRYYTVHCSRQRAIALAHYLISETASQDPKVGGPIQMAEIKPSSGYITISSEDIGAVAEENRLLNARLREFFVSDGRIQMHKRSYKVSDGAYFVPSWSEQNITYRFNPPPPAPGIGIPVLPETAFVDVDATSVGLTATTPDDEKEDTQGQGVIAVEELHNLIEQGWRIDSESSDYIFLVKGQRVNHLLHFLVGLFTIGVWWMVWIFIAAYGGEERRTVKKSSQ